MTGQILTDATYLKEVKAIEERLNSAIKQCESYFTLDSIMNNTNTDCLEILKYIKTGDKS